MATRRLGGLDLDRNVELSRTVPLDARQLVRTLDELLDAGSFTNGYNGMIVACRENQKVYMLIDQNNPTSIDSWKEVGASPADIQPISNAEIDQIIYGGA